jgi:hypothetical protein
MCSSSFAGEELQQRPGTVYADGNIEARWEGGVRGRGRDRDGWGMDKSEDASVGIDIPVARPTKNVDVWRTYDLSPSRGSHVIGPALVRSAGANRFPLVYDFAFYFSLYQK